MSTDSRIAFVQYAPYGQLSSNFSTTSQYQPVSQIQAPTVSSGEQRVFMSTASGTSLLSSGEQPPIPTVMPPV